MVDSMTSNGSLASKHRQTTTRFGQVRKVKTSVAMRLTLLRARLMYASIRTASIESVVPGSGYETTSLLQLPYLQHNNNKYYRYTRTGVLDSGTSLLCFVDLVVAADRCQKCIFVACLSSKHSDYLLQQCR